MKQRILPLLLSIALVFSGCGSTNETVVERVPETTPASSENMPETEESETTVESHEVVNTLVEENLLSVEVTVPASFYQSEGQAMTQENVDEIVKSSDFKSGTLNKDGSVTYTMSKEQHSTFLQNLKNAAQESVDDMINGENRTESFTKITFNDDLSEFKVYVDATKYTAFDSINAFVFYVAGQYYQLFSGTAFEDTEVLVQFINKDTDEIIESGSLSQARENLNSIDLSETETVSPEDANIENYADQLEVVGEYSYLNSIGDTYYCLIVKNNSDVDLEIGVNAIAKDANNASIGATSTYENAVAPNSEICLMCYFDSVEASSFEYSLEADEDSYYASVTNDLNVITNNTGDKVVIECENNGDAPAEFVEAIAIFLKEGEMVYYGSTYLTDSDSEIKPGKSIASDISSYQEYDEVKVFISGTKDK